jgi:hypothetical protein
MIEYLPQVEVYAYQILVHDAWFYCSHFTFFKQSDIHLQLYDL